MPQHGPSDDSSTAVVRLSGHEAGALRDPRVRGVVVAAAHSLAEREGVRIQHLEADDDGVTITLECDEVVAVALAAELRRSTAAWYNGKFGGTLW
jgi:hypothetical protein